MTSISKQWRVSALGVALGLWAAAGPMLAHHGRGNTYSNEEQTWKVKVTEVAFRNPHISFWADVADEAGAVTNWAFEGPNVSTMTRQGWYRNTLRPGQEIYVRFFKAQSGAPVGLFRGISRLDGEVIFTQGGGNTGID